MSVEMLIQIVLPILVAVGAGMLVWIFMEARMEAALAKERASLTEANSIISNHNNAWSDKVKAIEEAARRKAVDDLLQEIRTEERRFLRRGRSAQSGTVLIVQERLCFRGIPLTPWAERLVAADRGEELLVLPPGATFGDPAPLAADVVPMPAPLFRVEPELAGTQQQECTIQAPPGGRGRHYNDIRSDDQAQRNAGRVADIDVAIPVVFERAGQTEPKDEEQRGHDRQCSAESDAAEENDVDQTDFRDPHRERALQNLAEA
jgi:hypothetical protein